MSAVTAKELTEIVEKLLQLTPNSERNILKYDEEQLRDYKKATEDVNAVAITGLMTTSGQDDKAVLYVELERDGEVSYVKFRAEKCESFLGTSQEQE